MHAACDNGHELEIVGDDGVVRRERLLEHTVDRLVERQRIAVRRGFDELARGQVGAPRLREQRTQDPGLAHARTSRQDSDVVLRQLSLECLERGLLYRRERRRDDLATEVHGYSFGDDPGPSCRS